MVNKENIFGVFFMFKKNKFLKFGSGAALMASAPTLVSFAGEGKNYSDNQIQRNNIQDYDGLTCSTVVKFVLLGVTVIGLIIWGIAVARRKVELDNLNKQVDRENAIRVDRENAIRTQREKLNEALKKQGELLEKVQAEKKERDKVEFSNFEKLKDGEKEKLLKTRKVIIIKLNYLLGASGLLGKLSYLVDLCDYLALSAKKELSKEEQEKSNNLKKLIQDCTFFKDNSYCHVISEKKDAEMVLKDFISQRLKEEDLYDIASIENYFKNWSIDTFDAETFLVKGERNRDYSTLLNEFIKNLGDFNWKVKNWRWLKAQATPFMEYLQKEKEHLEKMKKVLDENGIDGNDKELVKKMEKYQKEKHNEKKEKTENEKELEKVQSKVFELREELKKLGVENENMNNKDFSLEEKRNNLGKNLYKPWFLSENYD